MEWIVLSEKEERYFKSRMKELCPASIVKLSKEAKKQIEYKIRDEIKTFRKNNQEPITSKSKRNNHNTLEKIEKSFESEFKWQPTRRR